MHPPYKTTAAENQLMDPSYPSHFSSSYDALAATGSSRQWPQGSVNSSSGFNRVKKGGGDPKGSVGRNPSGVAAAARPRIRRKPDPSAEKITPPCSECGRRFWSLKALFGHMRCHPERQWRGINPPPPPSVVAAAKPHRGKPFVDETTFSETEREVAGYLILLANGPPLATSEDDDSSTDDDIVDEGRATDHVDVTLEQQQYGRFECSGCKKVFGSHQALGGHRASHKNVKGCYAMNQRMMNGVPPPYPGATRVSSGSGASGGAVEEIRIFLQASAPRCDICWRLFESCEALGVHRYSHGETACRPEARSHPMVDGGYCNLDLNLAPMMEDGGGHEFDDEGLDLKLGI